MRASIVFKPSAYRTVIEETSHEERYCYHWSIKWFRCFNRARIGKRWSHCLCQYARNQGGNATQVKEVEKYEAEHNADLRAIELDVSSE